MFNTASYKNAGINKSSSSSIRYNNNAPQRSPKFAIVRLSEGTDVLRLYQLLLENGYPEVSFVNEMRENAFLPYSMQNQMQREHQNNDRSNVLIGGDKMNSTITPVNVQKKATFESVVHREQRQQQSLSSMLPQQQHQQQQCSSSSAAASPAGSSRAVRHAAIGRKASAGRASSSAPSNSAHFSHRLSRTIHNNTNGSGIVEDGNGGGGVLPAPSAASPSSSSSSTAATNGGGGDGAATVPLAGSATAKKNEEFAVCLLCNNRIMSSRLSNLTNHVRRHASLKQYRCCHCQYSHNEMAKVRLHMSHNHQDFSSQPMDMLSFEMQLQWGLLMEQCFPEHSKRFGPSAANSQFRNLEELQKYVDMEHSYTCIECGEVLTGYQLVNHLEDVHRQECVPFACGQCGYQSSSQWKVRLHISVKHPERAAETTVATLPAGSNFMLFLQKFFAEVHIPVEEDEVKLVAELQEKNSNRLLAAMNALTETDGEECANEEEEHTDADTLSASDSVVTKRNSASKNDSAIDSLTLLGQLKQHSPRNLIDEEDRELETNGANEGEEEEQRVQNGFEEEERARQTPGEEEEEEEAVSHQLLNEKLNTSKNQKVSSVRKRENSLTTEYGAEQPTTKRHNLRQSNRLIMVAEKRNTSMGGNGTAATPMAIGTRKK